jgi:hypothetical protein
MAICVDDPIATARETSYKKNTQDSNNWCDQKVINILSYLKMLLTNLSFIANITAIACSAAFPTIGSKTTLMNAIGMFQALEAACKLFMMLIHAKINK